MDRVVSELLLGGTKVTPRAHKKEEDLLLFRMA